MKNKIQLNTAIYLPAGTRCFDHSIGTAYAKSRASLVTVRGIEQTDSGVRLTWKSGGYRHSTVVPANRV
jgi:hypothetical protein